MKSTAPRTFVIILATKNENRPAILGEFPTEQGAKQWANNNLTYNEYKILPIIKIARRRCR